MINFNYYYFNLTLWMFNFIAKANIVFDTVPRRRRGLD
jgi:hypothetical protein